MSNNLSYCITHYLEHTYHLEVDEKLVFVLGSSLGLHLLPRGEYVSINSSKSLSSLYISPTNPLALEAFANSTDRVLCIHHHNNPDEVWWLAEEGIQKGRKFLVSLSDRILDRKRVHDSPVFGVVSVSGSLEETNGAKSLDNLKVKVYFTADKTLELPARDFVSYWVIDGNEQFNSNRYLLATSVANEGYKGYSDLYENAILRQYMQFQLEEAGCGIPMLRSLKSKLEQNPSEAEAEAHRELLLYSINKNAVLHGYDMNRKFFSKCLAAVRGSKDEAERASASEAYWEAGNAWEEVYLSLLSKSTIAANQVVELYELLLYRENNSLATLNKLIERWN